MCAIFGWLDTKNTLNHKQKNILTKSLGTASESRGTDATGIAFNTIKGMQIHKSPLPAHMMNLNVQSDTQALLGHTRMTTQGTEKQHENNHPFLSYLGFALTHNGIIHNDKALRKKHDLPNTNIETDSYIAVQLIEKSGNLSFEAIKSMAEELEGSFAFALLDHDNSLWFVKQDNPITLVFIETMGLYIYASTKEILDKALRQTFLKGMKYIQININAGEIVHLHADGKMDRDEFKYEAYSPYYWYNSFKDEPETSTTYKRIVDNCSCFGLDLEDVLFLYDIGYSSDEIEQLVSFPELFEKEIEILKTQMGYEEEYIDELQI